MMLIHQRPQPLSVTHPCKPRTPEGYSFLSAPSLTAANTTDTLSTHTLLGGGTPASPSPPHLPVCAAQRPPPAGLPRTSTPRKVSHHMPPAGAPCSQCCIRGQAGRGLRPLTQIHLHLCTTTQHTQHTHSTHTGHKLMWVNKGADSLLVGRLKATCRQVFCPAFLPLAPQPDKN